MKGLSAKEKLKKLFEWITKEENQRQEFANKCFDKNSMLGMQIHSAEASQCTKVRWAIEDLLDGEDWKSMEFNEAYVLMKRGTKIKLPEWKGYWYWNNELNTIVIHTKDGEELDIRNTKDVGFTMENICRNDWMEVK